MGPRAKKIWNEMLKDRKRLTPDEVRNIKEFLNQTNTHMQNYGFEEIVDTCKDAIRAELKAIELFKGKFDLVKAITWALQEYPNVKEAVDDFEQFKAEARDLFADETMDALAALDRELTETEKAESRLYRALKFAAFGFKNTTTVIELGKQQLALGADIFA